MKYKYHEEEKEKEEEMNAWKVSLCTFALRNIDFIQETGDTSSSLHVSEALFLKPIAISVTLYFLFYCSKATSSLIS